MKTIGVLTSGGDAPGMNAAIRAVVRAGIYSGCKVMGIEDGYDGLIKGHITEMKLSSVGDTIHKGGTILKSARSDDFKTSEGEKRALNVLDIFGIDGLVVIGGDGTLRGADRLFKLGVPVIGLPATIDNDLAYTEFTIGFHTVVNTVVNLMGNLRDTSASHGRANIVEVMGRACGDIALHAGLAGGAESIIVPEEKMDINGICKKLIKGRTRGKRHSIIVLAEGAGNAYELKEQIEEKTGIETRVTILGHIQRGGTPTATDRILASKMGARAITLLMEGNTGKAVGIQGNKIVDMDITEALAVKKEFDNESYLLSKILSI